MAVRGGPEWLMDGTNATVKRCDPEQRELHLECSGWSPSIVCSEIPEHWTVKVSVEGYGSSHISVRVGRQCRGVSWEILVAADDVKLSLGRAVNVLSVVPLGRTKSTTLEWARESGHLRLAPGVYQIAVGEDGNGTCSVTSIPSQDGWRARNGYAALELSGRAQVTRLQGNGAARYVIHRAAQGLSISDIDAPLEIRAESVGLAAVTSSDISIRGTLKGDLNIQANTVEAERLEGSGAIQADRVVVDEVKIEPGELVIATHLFRSARQAVGLDLRLEKRRDKPGTALFGFTGDGDRIEMDPSESSGMVELPSTLTPPAGLEVTSVNACSLSGEGDVHIVGDAADLTLTLDGSLLCTGDLGLSASPGNAVPHHAGDLSVSGSLDLSRSSLVVSRLLEAASISSGTVAGGDSGVAGALRVVTRNLVDCRLTADTVSIVSSNDSPELEDGDVEPAVSSSDIEAASHLGLRADVDSSSQFTWHGDADIAGKIATSRPLQWKPTKPFRADTVTTVLGGAIERVSIANIAHQDVVAQLLLADDTCVVDRVDVDGTAEFGWQTFPPGFADPTHRDFGVALTVVAEGATLRLRSGLGVLPYVEVGSATRIVAIATDEDQWLDIGLVSTGEVQGDVTVDAQDAAIRLVPPSNPAPEQERDLTIPAVRLWGGDIGVDTNLYRVTCENSNGRTPCLNVGSFGIIQELSGDFELVRLDGLIQGVTPSKDRRPIAKLKRWDRVSTDARQGQLVDVDITDLPLNDVYHLRSLEVLSPLAKPMIGSAKELKKHPANQIRAKAQLFRELNDVVRGRAVSGSTYTASAWAAAHSHALQVKKNSVERLMRCLHRLVGYGVRPGPALATYAVWTLAVATALWLCDSEVPGSANDKFRCNPSAEGEACGDYTFLDSIYRALLLPIAVVRSDIGGAAPYMPAFNHPAAHSLLVLATGIIVGFVVVALKNFLLRPKSDV